MLTLITSLIVVVSAYADTGTVVLGIRGAEKFAANVAETKSADLGLDDTSEFPNENTFSRVKTELIGRDVIVAVPEELAPDQLMETLIKIFTAKMSGARRVSVYLAGDIEDIRVSGLEEGRLYLENLFYVAGARRLEEKMGTKRDLRLRSISTSDDFVSRQSVLMNLNHAALTHELSEKTGIPVLGSAMMPHDSTVFLVAPPISPVNETIFQVMSKIQELTLRGNRVILVANYKYYARSDKVDQPGVSVTGRLVADLVEACGTSAVVFVRPHAAQSPGFYGIPPFALSGRQTIDKHLLSLGVQLVAAPDAGAQKDATFYAKDLNVGLVTINKYRNPLTAQIEVGGVVGEDPRGKVVAVIDDETASGKTLAEAATLLKERGALKVIAVVTHLAGKAEVAFDSPAIDQIVVTNTFPVENLANEKLTVLSIADEVAPVIKKISESLTNCDLELTQ